MVAKGVEAKATTTEGSTGLPKGFCSIALDGSATSVYQQIRVQREKMLKYLDASIFFS
jgi:hypothetical protein